MVGEGGRRWAMVEGGGRYWEMVGDVSSLAICGALTSRRRVSHGVVRREGWVHSHLKDAPFSSVELKLVHRTLLLSRRLPLLHRHVDSLVNRACHVAPWAVGWGGHAKWQQGRHVSDASYR